MGLLEFAKIVAEAIISKLSYETFECAAPNCFPPHLLGFGDDACSVVCFSVDVVINISLVQKLNGSIGLDNSMLGRVQKGCISQALHRRRLLARRVVIQQ